MNPVKFIFSTLFSNKNVIDGAKKQPWWLAIVLMLVSCIISVIPSFSGAMSTNGSDALTATQNYGVDLALKQFSLDYLGKDDYSFVIEDGKLKVENFEKAEVKINDKISLIVQYVDFTEADKIQYETIEKKMSVELSKLRVSYPVSGEENTSYLYSTLLLGKESLYLSLYGKDAKCTYSPNANSDGSYTINSYLNVENNYTQLEGTYERITGQLANISGYAYGNTDGEKVNNAFENWKQFFDLAYLTPRNNSAFITNGAMIGVSLLIVLSSTLMIFLLSKMKSSLRKFKFLESFKMVCYASFSPALIALLVGWLIPSFQSMAFVMCLVLRITWLGMKATGPQDTGTVRK